MAPQTFHLGDCSDCQEKNQVLDEILHHTFHLNICITCKQDRNLKRGWYKLITKSKAKQEYAIPESFFQSLPYVAKPNPVNAHFAPLKLYLTKTIIDEANRLYGDKYQLELVKRRRRQLSFAKAAEKANQVLKKRKGDEIETPRKNSLRKVSNSSLNLNENSPGTSRDHRHTFIKEYMTQASPGGNTTSWVKECLCGLKVEFEKW